MQSRGAMGAEAFLAEIADAGADAERVAASFARHLGTLKADDLPAAAQPSWREAARLLKCAVDTAMPARAVAAIKSWPASRIDELVGHIRALHAVLERLENERWEDDIRDKIRHAYL